MENEKMCTWKERVKVQVGEIDVAAETRDGGIRTL